jgi:hypothetical protein
MATTALEKIKALEEEHKQKIDALRSQAVSEVVKRIADLKAQLAEVEAEYTSLTGRDLRGEKAPGKEAGTRRRLSNDEKAALAQSVLASLKSTKEGTKLGALVTQLGESPSAIRDAIKGLGKAVVKTGNKASTLYFAK